MSSVADPIKASSWLNSPPPRCLLIQCSDQKSSMLSRLRNYLGESSFFWRNVLISSKSLQCARGMATDADAKYKFSLQPWKSSDLLHVLLLLHLRSPFTALHGTVWQMHDFFVKIARREDGLSVQELEEIRKRVCINWCSGWQLDAKCGPLCLEQHFYPAWGILQGYNEFIDALVTFLCYYGERCVLSSEWCPKIFPAKWKEVFGWTNLHSKEIGVH